MNTPGPGHPQTPSGLVLPPLVRGFIQDRYLAGTANAEAQYQYAAGDEDALTGALGALVSTSAPVAFSIDGNTQVVVEMSYRKIRGRGLGAPERHYGADGIFQLQMTVHGRRTFEKGLPFQAKKNWKGRSRQLSDQARDMKRTLGGGIVIDYTPHGYTACEIGHVIEARGNRRAVTQAGHMQPLGQVLANSFLACAVGIPELYYDDQSERFLDRAPESGFSVFDTNISIGEDRGDTWQEHGS